MYVCQVFKAQEVQSLECRLLGCLAAGAAPPCQPRAMPRARIKETCKAAQGGPSGQQSRLASGGARVLARKRAPPEVDGLPEPTTHRCTIHENGLFDDESPASEISAAHKSETAVAALREAELERLERMRAQGALAEVSRVLERLRVRLRAAEREVERLREAAACHEREAADAGREQSNARLQLQQVQVGTMQAHATRVGLLFAEQQARTWSLPRRCAACCLY